MNDTSMLDRLQGWYVAQCDGEWEHQHGLSIGTLDNPGWSISIGLTDTGLQSRPFERFEIERTERNWTRAWQRTTNGEQHAVH
jgi:hypothetical protein